MSQRRSSAAQRTARATTEFSMPGLDEASLSQAAHGAQAMTSQLGEQLHKLAGLKVPTEALQRIQADYMEEATALWNQSLHQAAEGAMKGAADRRFAAQDWSSNPMASYLASLYLLNARSLLQMAESIEGDEKTRQRVRFAVQQWVDASSPSNYLALNPEAQRRAIESKGQSVAQGLMHLWEDVQKGHVSQTDESVFEVGRNVATTEGRVVFENRLFQLIEYKPLTSKVYERPFLLVPPCINKFYILDLQPENSFIRHAVEQGHRTFVMSWCNPGDELAGLTWDDYIAEGPIRAIEVVREITGAKTINGLGFCVGGTILATALAVLAARGQQPLESLTLLTTLLDFADTGVLDLFVDEGSVRLREMTLGEHAPGGPRLLKGKELATTFSFLRPNDLVWNYVVGNYLKGETPPPFDLLYWNGDSTNLPGPMYCWYLRNTYLENKLKQPGATTVCGEKVDLGAIKIPAYIYGSREDHIVPWNAAYASTAVLKGPRRFVMGASGHIAGVINPPAKKKRSYWTGSGSQLPPSAQAWFDKATEHPGSWWTDWTEWLKPHGGKQVPAPKVPGGHGHKPTEPAPGRYVKVKA